MPDEPLDDAGPTLHGEYTAPRERLDTAAPTTRIDIPRSRHAPIALIVVAVAAASFLVGIGTASVTRPEADDPELTARDVGPSGDTIRFEGGEVRIPDGALAEVVRIVVHRSVVEHRVRIDAGDDDVVYDPDRLVAYRFAPSDVHFDEPAEITFRLPTGARNGTVFALRPDGSVVVIEGTLDADRGTAEIEVSDFRFRGSGR